MAGVAFKDVEEKGRVKKWVDEEEEEAEVQISLQLYQ